MHVWERSNRKRCWRCARVYIHVAGRIVCFCGPFSQLPQQRRCWLAEGLFVAGVMAAEVTLPCPFVRASSPSPPPPPGVPSSSPRPTEREGHREKEAEDERAKEAKEEVEEDEAEAEEAEERTRTKHSIYPLRQNIPRGCRFVRRYGGG